MEVEEARGMREGWGEAPTARASARLAEVEARDAKRKVRD